MEAPQKKFQELFCEHFGCPPEAYEVKMFWLSLYRHALPFASLIKILHPRFFEKDLAVIRQLGITSSQIEFQDEVQDYFYHVHSYGNFLQRVWRFRISGKRLIRLSKLANPGPPADASRPA